MRITSNAECSMMIARATIRGDFVLVSVCNVVISQLLSRAFMRKSQQRVHVQIR